MIFRKTFDWLFRPIWIYALLNFLALFFVNKVSDLPMWVRNWEIKATQIASFQVPTDNFYPPGAAILLTPFLLNKPNYEIAVYFYFVCSAVIYFLICRTILKNRKVRIAALLAFTLNPYLLWLANSSQDTVFELFLLLCGAALIVKARFVFSFFPIYLLCLTRPAYWVFFLSLPVFLRYAKIVDQRSRFISWRRMSIPLLSLMATLVINQATFGSPSLAHEGGLTAHFAHNKYYYLSLPKFDMDVFLSAGGNMDPKKDIGSSSKFHTIDDLHLRAALISIVENPKNFTLNTLQKLDSYLFAVQKNPQLPGEYYLSHDQKNIVIGDERLTWPLILGNIAYFIYRATLLILVISIFTLFWFFRVQNKDLWKKSFMPLILPYICGIVPGTIFYTESRFKVVSELLLIPVTLKIYEELSTFRGINKLITLS
jgi:hypothetical protein